MSETQMTQATSETSSSDSSKRKPKAATNTKDAAVPSSYAIFPKDDGPEVTPKDERRGVEVDIEKVSRIMNNEDVSERLRLASEIVQLDTGVEFCKASDIEWLEVSPDLLKHFCKGTLPEAGYYIYKNIKLCLVGAAEEIAKKDRLSCQQILFKDEANKWRVR